MKANARSCLAVQIVPPESLLTEPRGIGNAVEPTYATQKRVCGTPKMQFASMFLLCTRDGSCYR